MKKTILLFVCLFCATFSFAQKVQDVVYLKNGTLNAPDLEYCAMTLLGFKPEQISYCTRSTPKYSYNRHYRLKEKLTPDWYQLIFGKSAE